MLFYRRFNRFSPLQYVKRVLAAGLAVSLAAVEGLVIRPLSSRAILARAEHPLTAAIQDQLNGPSC